MKESNKGTKNSENKSGGPEGKKNAMLTKAATSSKGRQNQPKGSSKHNTKPRYAKPEKTKSSGKASMDEMEF